MKFRRFIRTPKGLLLAALSLLVVLAARRSGLTLIAPGLLAAMGTAILLDAPILRFRHPRWVFPDGAILTALIVAMILSPQMPWYVAAVTTAIAVLSKYVIRVGKANVFNPAAFGLVATFYLFDTGQSWWGALPDSEPWVLVLIGLFIAYRVHKLPVAISFLGFYFFLCTAVAFFGNAASVAELFRTPDLQAALFFAFFMVNDPPTSPPSSRGQLWYGAGVAVASLVVLWLTGAAYFLLAGLLVANAAEAVRRSRAPGRRS